MDSPHRPPVHRVQAVLHDLSHFPWKITAQTLRERFREDRLGLTASSLTFTTILALVPFFTVVLAVFSAFPMFGRVQEVLQAWLLHSLVPDSISRPVLDYLGQFAAKASQLGLVGFSVLIITALALMLTVDRTFNNIWRVQRLRPLGQRVLIYWAAITFVPLLLGSSLALTSYAISASRGLVESLPNGVELFINSLQFLVLAGGMASLYRSVPNTQVRWRHALAGGVFVSVCMELAKKGLALYLARVPTYSAVYGTFATLPILLVWIYIAWVIVLLGAVVAAYLPSLMAGVARRSGHQGWAFELAVETLQHLQNARLSHQRGVRVTALARRLRVDALQLAPALEALLALDWIARIEESTEQRRDEPRLVLLADPATTQLAPLVQRLLLERGPHVEALWQGAQFDHLSLADALGAPAGESSASSVEKM
ncbi:MAG: YihY family inner membrane protein [Giesbergeria sp.]